MRKILFPILALMFFVSSAKTQTRDWNAPPYAEDYAFITNDGAWCWFSDPRAIYVDNKMFGGFVDKEGSIWAFSYDPETQLRQQYKLSDRFNYDDHANPSVMELPDKRLVIYFSAHGGTVNSPIYYAVSKNPADISSWENLQSIDPKMPGSLGVCYTNAAMLSEEANRTYLFFRGRNFKPTCIYSDDLKTWSDPVSIVVNDSLYGESGRPYMKVTTNHKNKIFFAFTDAHPRDRATNSIYFMMYKDGKLCKADGSVISEKLGPVMPSQTDKVYDATKTFDKAWIWDVAFDKNENPVLVYARFSHACSIHSYWYAKWDGGKWVNIKITDAAQCFMRNDYNNKNYLETEENYSGGVYLDHENPSVVYTSRPINNVFEIEKWTLTGGENVWKSEAVTKDSERDNIRPFVVRNHSGNQPDVLWVYNYKYPGFRSYESAIRVNQKAKGFDSGFNKEAIKVVATAVADWQLRDYETAPFNSSVARGWRNGVLYNGMFDWAVLSDNDKYFKYLENVFDKESWQVGNRMYNADDICVAQAYLDMYSRYKKEYMLIPTLARGEWVVNHQPEGNIDITKGHSDRWWWCDALYMAPAVYSRLYTITGNKSFMKFADKELKATYDHLYDKKEKLFYRDAKYFVKREANGEKIFWGRGNGWVMGGLAELLKTLPENDKMFRPFYVKLFKEMSTRVAELQCEDGFWRASLLDPVTYSDPEISSTGLFVYALAYGINQGYISKEKYLPVVIKGWKALVASVDTEGKVGWVQPVGQAPKRIEKRMTQVYGTGGFLMAACEVYRLVE
ncbi:glycoside hydrolase family 88 protein [uncultured Parabacteroides sp.]|uniref:glycoside hydrolase family 88 protein n=1 Tax=uncultured Parabacteroides sp. TaxID=512312 RepID=UPI0025F4EEFC|nr:glycoside hydrolase family 88 protein [uncultured Parabacteroides sp.]